MGDLPIIFSAHLTWWLWAKDRYFDGIAHGVHEPRERAKLIIHLQGTRSCEDV